MKNDTIIIAAAFAFLAYAMSKRATAGAVAGGPLQYIRPYQRSPLTWNQLNAAPSDTPPDYIYSPFLGAPNAAGIGNEYGNPAPGLPPFNPANGGYV